MFKKIFLSVLIIGSYAVAMEEQNKSKKPVFKNELCELLHNLMNKDCAADVTTKTTEFLLFKSRAQLKNEDLGHVLQYAESFRTYIKNQYMPCLATATPVGPFNYTDTETEMNSYLDRINQFCVIMRGQIHEPERVNGIDTVRQRISVIGTLDS